MGGGNLKSIFEKVKNLSYDNDGYIISTSRTKGEACLDSDKCYVVGHKNDSVTDGSSLEMLIDNPSGSGKELAVNIVFLDGSGAFDYEVYRNSSISSSGTTITARNRKIGANDSSVTNIEYGGTYATGTLLEEKPVGSGTKKDTVGGNVRGTTFRVLEDNNIHMVITNKAGATERFAITSKWREA